MRYALLALAVLTCSLNLTASPLEVQPPRFRALDDGLILRPPENAAIEEVQLFGLSEIFEERHWYNRSRRRRFLPSTTGDRRLVDFKAFGKHFALNLTVSDEFLAPLVVIQKGTYSRIHNQRIISPSGGAAKYLSLGEPSRGCHYYGTINGDADSFAVGSLCYGLLGLFRHDGVEYYIEPSRPLVEGATAVSHYVYKMDSGNANVVGQQPSDWCGHVSARRGAIKANATTFGKQSSHSQHARRHKRSTSVKRYVELMVVADHLMVQKHGKHLENYLMTLISVVAGIYRNHTIGNNVNIVLVKIVILESEQEGPMITSDAHTTLRSFCTWQHSKNDPNDDQPHHHDAALLITRQDLCRAPTKCDTLGLAEIGTICKSERSCAIVEDNGLSAAFTIAHELGHLLGLTHDDDDSCVKKRLGTLSKYSAHSSSGHIMASTLDFKAAPWTWSACSRKYLTENFDIPMKADCLRDQPTTALQHEDMVRSYEQQMPGERYSPDAQCSLVFGNGSTICPFLPKCDNLWCMVPNVSGCRTQHMLWADGTKCDVNKWCYRGSCVERSPIPEPVDGGWSDWSPYGECSRPCDGGVKRSERDCTRPEPRNGGSYCVGRRVRYRSCNRQACPDGTPDFRKQQCSKFDGHHFNIQNIPPGVKWTPYYIERASDQCKLFCRFENSYHAHYLLSDKVIDGTKCGLDTFDMCINGVCQPAGCDHELGSPKAPDMCGVCGGDNSTCETLTGSFVGPVEKGYNNVFKIPAGAFLVEVTQTSYHGGVDDDTYLAMADLRGKFFLNGNYHISRFPTDIVLGNGAVIQYNGSENRVEKLTVAGRLQEPLIIMVLVASEPRPANVHYSYVVPLHADIFEWRLSGSWSDCSRLCRGKRRRKAVCVQKEDVGSRGMGVSPLEVPDSKCRLLVRPDDEKLEEACNTHCDIGWRTTEVGECSAYCGQGLMKASVECVMYAQNLSGSSVVADKNCDDSEKPRDFRPCTGKCLPAVYQYADWTECSATCGGGTQRRAATCTSVGSGREAPEEACNSREKLTVRQCNVQECPPPPRWVQGEWSQCSVSCGKGESHRIVTCRQADDAVDDSLCAQQSQPASKKLCVLYSCPHWRVEPWQQCTVTCGSSAGVLRRIVRCISVDGQVMDESVCSAAERPDDYKPCNPIARCPATSTVSTTTAPTRSSSAASTRTWAGIIGKVQTVPVLHTPLSHMSAFTRLPVTELTLLWTTKPDRSASTFVPATLVALPRTAATTASRVGEPGFNGTKPHASKQIADLTTASSPRRGVPASNVTTAPPNPRVATVPVDNAKAGPQWRFGAWAACSATCGWGRRMRYVSCRGTLGQKLEDEYCSATAVRPPQEEDCRESYCGSWHTGRWSKCSSSCGEDAVQSRYVACAVVDQRLQVVNDTECAPADRPPSVQPCEPLPESCLGTIHMTTAARLTKAMQSVETSGRTAASPTPPPPSLATTSSVKEMVESSPRPPPLLSTVIPIVTSTSSITAADPSKNSVQSAHSGSFWRVGQWSPCSASCNGGWRRRAVMCQRDPVMNSGCDTSVMPPEVELCSADPCKSWLHGQWLSCSVTCGQGVRQREVICAQPDGSRLPADSCEGHPKPTAATEPCTQQPCPRPDWLVTAWSPCSATCGEGERRRKVQCVDMSTNVSAVLDETQCSAMERPISAERCMTADQCPVWSTSPWSKCSITCGSGGIQTRSVNCVRSVNMSTGETQSNGTLPFEACGYSSGNGSSAGPAPPSTRPCHPAAASCPTWRVSGWSPCSMSCGSGIRHRQVVCVATEDGRELPLESCLVLGGAPPANEETCFIRPCTSWRPAPWSECSATCGNGTRWRVIYCADDLASRVTQESHCEHTTKPRTIETCHLAECFKWTSSAWSKCSSSCGRGVLTRTIACQDGSSTAVPMHLCDSLSKPESTMDCGLMPACPLWTATTKWSPCSASCGTGRRTRTVLCLDADGVTVNSSLCLGSERPSDSELCFSQACSSLTTTAAAPASSTYEWVTQKWSACSASCGAGVKRRSVSCVDASSGNAVPHWRCSGQQPQPKSSRECHEQVCPFAYYAEPWSSCSASCGEGRQMRRVTCKAWTSEGWQVGDSTLCSSLDKPPSFRSCSLGPCYASYVWRTGSWSQCSAFCGWGTAARNVSCIGTRDGGKPAPKEKCNMIFMPDRTSRCHSGPCYAKSCVELQSLGKILVDGEYRLLLFNQLIKIYCKGMNGKLPTEYLTLSGGSQHNYAQIYGQRLRRPGTCPQEGGGNMCGDQCLPTEYDRAGLTRFLRLRLNITTMTALVDDFEFSESVGIHRIPFGTAGDCYSTLPGCTRGHFRVNLTGTGFRVSRHAMWYSQGTSVKARIQRLQDGQVVHGECGGYCGSCSLQSSDGLPLEIITT